MPVNWTPGALPPGHLTMHFTLAELTASQTAARRRIKNEPGAAAYSNLLRLAATLEEVRRLVGNRPVLVSSGYRCQELNAAIGGASNSAHTRGLAADFTVPAFGNPHLVCKLLLGCGLRFDQLIYEGTWVHLGLADVGMPARGEVLTAVFNPGKPTGYLRGLGLRAA